jgi:hypothetical protein
MREPLKPGQAGVQRGGVEYHGQLAILESFPVQLAASVTLNNISQSAVTLDFPDSCVVLLRAYQDDRQVWDQGESVFCAQMIQSVTLAPGESRTFQARTTAFEILGKDLADGRYRISGYLRTAGEIVEVEVGEADLAIPRA